MTINWLENRYDTAWPGLREQQHGSTEINKPFFIGLNLSASHTSRAQTSQIQRWCSHIKLRKNRSGYGLPEPEITQHAAQPLAFVRHLSIPTQTQQFCLDLEAEVPGNQRTGRWLQTHFKDSD